MNLISFKPLNIDVAKSTNNFAIQLTPSKPLSVGSNFILSPKIKATPAKVLNSFETQDFKTPILSARESNSKSQRHHRLGALGSNPDFLLNSTNVPSKQTAGTNLQQSAKKKQFLIPKIPIQPIKTLELDLPSQREFTDINSLSTKRCTSQKLSTTQRYSSEKRPARLEGQSLFTDRKYHVNKSKPQYLPDLFKEVLHPVDCKTRGCHKCGSHQQQPASENKTTQQSGSQDYPAKIRALFPNSVSKGQSNNQPASLGLSKPNIKYIAVRTGSGLNFKKTINIGDTSQSQEFKLEFSRANNSVSKNLHAPARHLETEVPRHYRFASNTIYYEAHGDFISGKVVDHVNSYRNRTNDTLADYKRRVKEHFDNRFGSTQFAQEKETENIHGSFNNPEEVNETSMGGLWSKKDFHQRPLKFLAGLEFDSKVIPTRNLKTSYRTTSDTAKLKMPEGYQKKSMLDKRGTKSRSIYNPFERRKSSDSSDSIDMTGEALRDLIELRPKMGEILPPQNPIFKEANAQSHLMQEIVTGDPTLKLIRPQKINFKRIRVKLVEALKSMKLLKLTPQDIMKHHIFSTAPYEKKHSRELITACKIEDQEAVGNLLDQNRFLVYDFDNMHMTSLHWAIKRNNFTIAQMLIDRGADTNAADLIGRTPLYFAIKYNCINIIKLLLFSYCDPWSPEEYNYTELCKNKPVAKYYLSKGRQIHIIMKMTPPRIRENIWQKESLKLILDPRNSHAKINPDEFE